MNYDNVIVPDLTVPSDPLARIVIVVLLVNSNTTSPFLVGVTELPGVICKGPVTSNIFAGDDVPTPTKLVLTSK